MFEEDLCCGGRGELKGLKRSVREANKRRKKQGEREQEGGERK